MVRGVTVLADEALLPAAAGGDEAAVESLLGRYWSRAFAVALRLTGEHGAAEDAVQDAFVSALRKAAQFDPARGAFKAWFFRIVENSARNHLRAAGRRRAHEGAAQPAGPEPERPAHDDLALVLEELSALAPELRAAVTLRHVEGMSFREIGETLGCPEGTATSRVARGTEALRERLARRRAGVASASLPLLFGAPVAAPSPPAARTLLRAAAEGAGVASVVGAASWTGIPAARAAFAVFALLTLGGGLVAALQAPASSGTAASSPEAALPASGSGLALATSAAAPFAAESTTETGAAEVATRPEVAALRVRVRDEEGRPVPGVRLSLTQPGSAPARQGVSDADGLATLGQVQPGPARLVCEETGHALFEVQRSPAGVVAAIQRRPVLGEPSEEEGIGVHTEDLPGANEELVEVVMDAVADAGLADGTRVVIRPADAVLAARSPGPAVELTLVADDVSAGIEVLLVEPILAVTGRVVDPEGRPVAGARLAWRRLPDIHQGGSWVASSRSGPDGGFAIEDGLTPGELEVVAEHSDWAWGASRGELAPGRQRLGLTVTLGQPCAVSGRLVGLSPPVVGRVEAVAAGEANLLLGDRVRRGSVLTRRETAEVGPDGAFRLRNLHEGTVDLIGLAPGCPPIVLERVRVERGGTTAVELRVAAGRVLGGTFVDGQGRPLRTHARLRAILMGPEGLPVRQVEGVTQGAERWELVGLEDGSWDLSVWAEGRVPVLRHGVRAGTTDLSVALVEVARVVVRPVVAGGPPPRDVACTILSGDDAARFGGDAVRPDGTLFLDAVDPAATGLRVEAEGYHDESVAFSPPLQPGETREVPVRLRPTGAPIPPEPTPEELGRRLQAARGEAAWDVIDQVRQLAQQGNGHPPRHRSERVDLLPLLAEALSHPTAEVRDEAACALAYMHTPAAYPLLRRALEPSNDRTVRTYALMGLGWLHDEAALRDEIVALHRAIHADARQPLGMRTSAASSLLEWDLLEDPAVFVEALRDPRGNAALASGALARLGRRDTIELMVERLRTAVPDGDRSLGLALGELTGQSFGADYLRWKAWLEANRPSLPPRLR